MTKHGLRLKLDPEQVIGVPQNVQKLFGISAEAIRTATDTEILAAIEAIEP